MSSRMLSTVLFATFSWCKAAVDGQVSLVQSVVQVHDTDGNEKVVKGRFLVDNSELKHSGPGVLLRKSKSLEDIVGFDEFLAWGTVFDGQTAGEGWVKYEKYFLPTTVKGSQVMTLQKIVLEKDTATIQKHPAFVYRFHYAPTSVKLSGSGSAPCRIVHKGGKPETYNVEVFPPHFASYNMTNIPASMLERVRRIREFDPVVKPAPEPVDSIHFIVKEGEEGEGVDDMAIKMFRISPIRTMMKMACDRSGISWYRCQKKTKFLWKGTELNQDAFTYNLNMTDGETITMVKA